VNILSTKVLCKNVICEASICLHSNNSFGLLLSLVVTVLVRIA